MVYEGRSPVHLPNTPVFYRNLGAIGKYCDYINICSSINQLKLLHPYCAFSFLVYGKHSRDTTVLIDLL